MEFRKSDTYDYCLMTFSGFSGQKIIDTLAKLGKEGWELTGVSIEENGQTKQILKRKLEDFNILGKEK